MTFDDCVKQLSEKKLDAVLQETERKSLQNPRGEPVAILAALHRRDRTGEGQHLDVIVTALATCASNFSSDMAAALRAWSARFLSTPCSAGVGGFFAPR